MPVQLLIADPHHHLLHGGGFILPCRSDRLMGSTVNVIVKRSHRTDRAPAYDATADALQSGATRLDSAC
eukprot:6186974-Pleurochrysis_carterae.AAC.1